MSGDGRYNGSGLPMFHLRRIGPPATKPRVADIMDFFEVTTMIGKSAQSTYIIDSASEMRRMYISRNHARVVIRTPSNNHKLFDDSMNGVFVNNLKILHNVVLHEGDRVTFGHPQGAKIPAGIRKLQPDSEYQFLFEKCNCPGQMIVNHRPSDSRSFVVPEVPVHAGKSSAKKRDRNTTKMLTTKDVLKLKEEYEQKSFNHPSTIPSEPSNRDTVKSRPDSPAPEDTTATLSVSNRPQICDTDTSHTHDTREGLDTEATASDNNTSHSHPVVESASVSSEQMDTESSATAERDVRVKILPEKKENKLQQEEEKCITDPSEWNSGYCGEFSMNSANLTEQDCLEGNGIDPSKCSCSDEDFQDSASLDSASQDSASQDSASQDIASQDSASLDSASQDSASLDSASLDSASPSVEDSFELVANLPNNGDSQSGKETCPCPPNTSTPKPKQAVHKSQVSPEDGRSVEGNISKTSAILRNLTHAGQSDQTSQKDAAIQTSPLIPLVDELPATDSQRKRQYSADQAHDEEEDPMAQSIVADTIQQTDRLQRRDLATDEGDTDLQLHMSSVNNNKQDDLSNVTETTPKSSGLDANMCLQKNHKVLEIFDLQPEIQVDSEVQSCTSQSTDSAECPTEIMIQIDNQDYNYVGMFEDSDMDESEFAEDTTAEVCMDTSDNVDRTEQVSDDADRTEIVLDVDPADDFDETLNKTGDISVCDVKRMDDGQFDKTETEQDISEDMDGSDVGQLDKTEQNISKDIDENHDKPVTKSYMSDKDEVKEQNSPAGVQSHITEVTCNGRLLTKIDFADSATPVLNEDIDLPEENVKNSSENSEMEKEVVSLVCKSAYSTNHEVETDVVKDDSPNSVQENLEKTFNDEELEQLGGSADKHNTNSFDMVIEDEDDEAKVNKEIFKDVDSPIQAVEQIKNETNIPIVVDVNPRSADDSHPCCQRTR
ncbi:uncharacterized protein LOC117338487 [Pecten maximus]|uniref:uncharacterized protein LOC117338487 n=1 Tax=Pecten maximus TaxID=6579 RepID=UPI001458B7B2|nr:uncharacterized protein LOC117338487 [Pecten maximus]